MRMVVMKTIVRKATFLHFTKYDDDDNDHGDYDDDNVNANADLYSYVKEAPCLFLHIAQLRAASTIPPPITNRTAP